MSTSTFSTRKDRREPVTPDRVANRKARAAGLAREDRRATTKSARRHSYLKAV